MRARYIVGVVPNIVVVVVAGFTAITGSSKSLAVEMLMVIVSVPGEEAAVLYEPATLLPPGVVTAVRYSLSPVPKEEKLAVSQLGNESRRSLPTVVVTEVDLED